MSRKNISISAEIEKRANAIMKARGISGLSELAAVLIREEMERRRPPYVVLDEDRKVDAREESAIAEEPKATYGKPSKKPLITSADIVSSHLDQLDADKKRKQK